MTRRTDTPDSSHSDGDGTSDAPSVTDAPDTPPTEGMSDTGGTPDKPDKPAARSRKRSLWLALGALVAIAGVLALLRPWRSRDQLYPLTNQGSADGKKPAIRSPDVPRMPGDPGRDVRLTGIIVDGTGAPVTGAEISAELERGIADRALSTTPSGASSGSGASGGAASGSAASGSAASGSAASGSGAAASGGMTAGPIVTAAPTGSDGRFAIEGLLPGRYRLRVTGPGLLAAEVRYVPVPSDEARIVVARQVRIDGTVTDGRAPAPNVSVGLRSDAIGGAIETKTDAKGAFHFPELPEGRYQLFAWQGSLAARAVRVNRLGAGPFAPIELPLEQATIVVGRVIDREEGTGIVAAIELRPSGDDQAPRYARSGDDGVFRIEGVPNGRWIADAFAPSYASPGGVELEAGHGVPELALTRAGTIEGVVRDGDGRPIAGASVRVLGLGEGGAEHSAAVEQDRLRRFSGRIAAPLAATTLASTGADPALLPRGELGVLIGPIPPIPPPGAQIARPASLDPTAPTTAATVLLGEPPPLGEDAAHASIWTTGSDGAYRVRGVPKGRVTVLAIAAGYAEGHSAALGVDLGQTVRGIDITLSAGTIIVGRVTDQHRVPIVGAQVSAIPLRGSSGTTSGATSNAASNASGSTTASSGSTTASSGSTTASSGSSASGSTTGSTTGSSASGSTTGSSGSSGSTTGSTGSSASGSSASGSTTASSGSMPSGASSTIDVYTDDDGNFRLGPVSGTVEIVATAYGHADARVTLELAAARGSVPAERRQDLTLAVADAVFAGMLDDATGVPVPAAVLDVIGGAADGRHAVVAADGTFAIDALPAGPLRVRITHPDYPPFETDGVAGAPNGARVRLRLPLGGAVEGVLLDGGSGAPMAGIALAAEGPAKSAADATTDKDGRWKLGPLAPGHWKIGVALPGYRPALRELDVPVSRAPGITSVRDVRIDLLRGALVGGTVRDSRGQRIGGARITIAAADGSGTPAEGVTDSAGEFVVHDCPTGELLVTANRGVVRGAVNVSARAGDEVLGLTIELR